jgi:beta-fructofuranosidase
MPPLSETARSRGRDAGVSEKTSGAAEEMGFLGAGSGADADGFPWSNAMLQWQRTGFHFQPEMNWMNGTYDPSITPFLFPSDSGSDVSCFHIYVYIYISWLI